MGIINKLLDFFENIRLGKYKNEDVLEDNVVDIDERCEMFYEKYFSQEAKSNLCNKEWILHYCIKKAWIDATMSERFKSGSEIIKNKEYIIAFLEKELLNNQKFICENFEQWHNLICECKEYNMRYGVWQKLINMTFKYLYCIKEIFPEFSSVWGDCHCPIDTVIAKEIHDKLKKMGVSQSELVLSKKVSISDSVVNWNNITKTDYLKLQKQIKLICEEDDMCPIEFDFVYWKN